MDYALLVKIKADNSDDALSEARDQVEQSCGNNQPFDYMSDDVTLVTKEVLVKEGVKSFTELERHWKGLTDDNIKEHKAGIKDEVFFELCKRFLSGKDALTYLNYKDRFGSVDDRIQKLIEQASKTKVAKPKLPVGLDELAEMIADLIRPLDNHLAMGAYHLKCLDKLCNCKMYPDETSHTLYCYDCHFANLGGTGKKKYYFLFDRHA